MDLNDIIDGNVLAAAVALITLGRYAVRSWQRHPPRRSARSDATRGKPEPVTGQASLVVVIVIREPLQQPPEPPPPPDFWLPEDDAA
ncbi:hypothetical protein RB614_35615 [Phytohabitans sp. ZYX-F-186]|uniref:Uncharacterized protein n=1 Tax=Phytohabitans maris TaxID=3071409 RepID=A0ABU0ZS41_9ACTN|nr:hypothetical protein [Phytohabitans sp. ZYX-F-186]MDQ7909839.1 hypothetical protein [Phytohabitans sp. ZYX-F-186]